MRHDLQIFIVTSNVTKPLNTDRLIESNRLKVNMCNLIKSKFCFIKFHKIVFMPIVLKWIRNKIYSSKKKELKIESSRPCNSHICVIKINCTADILGCPENHWTVMKCSKCKGIKIIKTDHIIELIVTIR